LHLRVRQNVLLKRVSMVNMRIFQKDFLLSSVTYGIVSYSYKLALDTDPNPPIDANSFGSGLT
jgi:hypothetical protein